MKKSFLSLLCIAALFAGHRNALADSGGIADAFAFKITQALERELAPPKTPPLPFASFDLKPSSDDPIVGLWEGDDSTNSESSVVTAFLPNGTVSGFERITAWRPTPVKGVYSLNRDNDEDRNNTLGYFNKNQDLVILLFSSPPSELAIEGLVGLVQKGTPVEYLQKIRYASVLFNGKKLSGNLDKKVDNSSKTETAAPAEEETTPSISPDDPLIGIWETPKIPDGPGGSRFILFPTGKFNAFVNVPGQGHSHKGNWTPISGSKNYLLQTGAVTFIAHLDEEKNLAVSYLRFSKEDSGNFESLFKKGYSFEEVAEANGDVVKLKKELPAAATPKKK